MKNKSVISLLALLVFLSVACFVVADRVFAHCDTMDGPVIKAAQKALETGNVNLALIWVQKDDEAAIKKAFESTLSVRKLNPQAQELADMYFFETLVRIHRQAEGAPYTGIKASGSELGPAVLAADKALETSSVESLLKFLTDTVHSGVISHFQEVMARRNYSPDDIPAGREYVEAYVKFMHYAEGIYEAAAKTALAHPHKH